MIPQESLVDVEAEEYKYFFYLFFVVDFTIILKFINGTGRI